MNPKNNRPAPYNELIDDEIWAFIEQTNACFPAHAVNASVATQRELYNAMCDRFRQPRPSTVNARDVKLVGCSVAAREYTCKQVAATPTVTVIYYHGGGFVVGNLESHDDVCAEICAATRYRVIACDYRLAPEHCHPAAFEDALETFKAVLQQYTGKVLLVGDSAGANLAAAVAGEVRQTGRQAIGQVLIYPYLGAPTDAGSAITHAHAPMLSTADLDYYHKVRVGAGKLAMNDTSFAPLWSDDFEQLPATVVFAAQCDPLCDDGMLYSRAVTEAGGQAHFVMEKGLVHGYLRARNMSTRAAASFDGIVRAIAALGTSTWPY